MRSPLIFIADNSVIVIGDLLGIVRRGSKTTSARTRIMPNHLRDSHIPENLCVIRVLILARCQHKTLTTTIILVSHLFSRSDL